jgi:hypothetical protein
MLIVAGLEVTANTRELVVVPLAVVTVIGVETAPAGTLA